MPSIATTKLYEAVYILDPDQGEEQVSAITSKYKDLIETNGGAIVKIDVWERRKLAYAIKGRTEGIYVIMHFTGEPSVESELRRIFQISEDQLRYMIVKPEEAPSEQAEAAPRYAAPEASSSTAEPFAQASPSLELTTEDAVETPEVETPEIETPAPEEAEPIAA